MTMDSEIVDCMALAFSKCLELIPAFSGISLFVVLENERLGMELRYFEIFGRSSVGKPDRLLR